MRRSVGLLLSLVSCEALTGPDLGTVGRMPEDSRSDDRRFDDLSSAYLAWHYAQHPAEATENGVHEYDDAVEEVSRDDIQARVAGLYYHLRKLGKIDRARLSGLRQEDAAILEGRIRAEIVELERMRRWERDPSWYVEILAEGFYSVTFLSTESLPSRMGHAERRLREAGAVFRAARENLSNPPREWTELAIADLDRVHRFVRRVMMMEFEPAIASSIVAGLAEGPPGLIRNRNRWRAWQEFSESRAEALRRIEEFSDWLRTEGSRRAGVLPVWGAEVLGEYLLHREGIRISPAELLTAGKARLDRTRRSLESTAAEVERDVPPALLVRKMRSDHPKEEEILDGIRAAVGHASKTSEGFVTLPNPRISVAGTLLPCSDREIRIECPGEGTIVRIDLPDPSWPEDRKEAHLARWPRAGANGTAIAEGIPGRVVARLAAFRAGGIRRVFRSRAFEDGWALYAGRALGASDGWSRLALTLRETMAACRWVAALEIHLSGMSLDDAAGVFEREAHLDREAARMEATRASLDPLRFAAAWGADRIEEVVGGDRKESRDRLLSEGLPPLPRALERVKSAR